MQQYTGCIKKNGVLNSNGNNSNNLISKLTYVFTFDLKLGYSAF